MGYSDGLYSPYGRFRVHANRGDISARSILRYIDNQWVPSIGEHLNVRDFGAVGDGTTSDQTAVAAAVAAAYAAGAELYWPAGTYLTTATIPNFHDVRHYGPGAVERGSSTFYVAPRGTQTNTIYVSASGSASNDGITSSEPTTLDEAATILLAYADRGLPGRWVVQGAAGTYTVKFNLDSLIQMDYPIELKGPTAGHPNVPTMIIDMSGDTSGRGVAVSMGGWLWVRDVKVINATAGNGFYNQASRLSLYNCHVDNCQYGIVYLHDAIMEVFGGDYDGNRVSGSTGVFGRYGSSHSIGLDDDPDNAALFHDWDIGIRIGEGVFGHLDGTRVHDCDIDSGSIGVQFDRTSGGCNTKNMQIYGNSIGILAEGQWFNNNIDFGSGADANTVNVRTNANGSEYVVRALNNTAKTPRLQQFLGAQSPHTGTLTNTTLWTISGIVQPWMVSEAIGDYIELEIAFTSSLTNAACGFTLYINDGGTDDSLTAVTIPQNTTDFIIRATIFIAGASAQLCTMSVVAAPAQGTDMVDEGAGAVALKGATGNVKLTCLLGHTSDSVALRWAKCITTLGG